MTLESLWSSLSVPEQRLKLCKASDTEELHLCHIREQEHRIVEDRAQGQQCAKQLGCIQGSSRTRAEV